MPNPSELARVEEEAHILPPEGWPPQPSDPPSWDQRAEASAATRLAYTLHKAGILSDFGLADFLYPSTEAIEQAEEGKLDY